MEQDWPIVPDGIPEEPNWYKNDKTIISIPLSLPQYAARSLFSIVPPPFLAPVDDILACGSTHAQVLGHCRCEAGEEA